MKTNRASAISRRGAILGLAFAVAGCANGFGRGLPGAGGGAGAGGLEPGSAADPRSPAYFQEAIGDRVYFAVDEATLSPEARAILDAQARWLMENPEFNAVIEGHADERGTREYNLALGARRAAAVRDYLVSVGVAASRLSTVSYGKERPVAVCSDESCYSQNRRAVTVLQPAAMG